MARKKDKEGPLAQMRASKSRKRLERRARQLKKIPARQLLKLLAVQEMEAIAEQCGVDEQVKHLFGPLLVQLFILAVLDNEDHSLQSLAELYNSSRFGAFSGKGGHQTAKSSLADRLSSIKCTYLEQLYEAYVRALKGKYGKALGKKHGWLTRFDSTMLALCASLTEIGMRVGAKPKKGAGKVQIKVTLGLEGLLPSTLEVFHEQSKLSEEKALKEVIESQAAETQGVIVFDMGLKSRKTFAQFDQQGRLFVTRLKAPRYEKVRTHKLVKGRLHGDLRLQSDEIVHLYQSGSSNLLPHEFRLITATCYKGQHAGQTFYFLTNILDLSAGQIADIYQRRWDIEVFFRFLKQEVGLRHLLSTKENGIRAVIYLRILVGTMIWAYAHLNKRTDYRQMKREFRSQVEDMIFDLRATIASSLGPKEKRALPLELRRFVPPRPT